jgi:peptidyl-prolyl cis-trans isomerase SurA
MVTQIGSLDKVIKYYKKNTEEEFRSYLRYFEREQASSEMQKKIVEEVEITPEEVRNFFKSIPKEDLLLWCRNGGGSNSNYA